MNERRGDESWDIVASAGASCSSTSSNAPLEDAYAGPAAASCWPPGDLQSAVLAAAAGLPSEVAPAGPATAEPGPPSSSGSCRSSCGGNEEHGGSVRRKRKRGPAGVTWRARGGSMRRSLLVPALAHRAFCGRRRGTARPPAVAPAPAGTFWGVRRVRPAALIAGAAAAVLVLLLLLGMAAAGALLSGESCAVQLAELAVAQHSLAASLTATKQAVQERLADMAAVHQVVHASLAAELAQGRQVVATQLQQALHEMKARQQAAAASLAAVQHAASAELEDAFQLSDVALTVLELRVQVLERQMEEVLQQLKGRPYGRGSPRRQQGGS